jgi:hypothetical protein
VRELADAFADIHRSLRRGGAARAAAAILECAGRTTGALASGREAGG